MIKSYNRRKFLQTATLGVAGVGSFINAQANNSPHFSIPDGGRIGIIGLDTSHSIAFVEALNAASPSAIFEGYKVVAAYPWGSRNIPTSTDRIPGYTEQVKKFGVEVVDSIADLLQKVDVVMLETNDGNPHLEQALEVMRSGKRIFVDKPVAATLEDVLLIYEAAKDFKVPVFSSSSLRYNTHMKETVAGEKVGKIVGADTFSPATLEKTQADFFWYGIHGIEMLYTLMGTGCESAMRVNTKDTDIVVGKWKDGRLGTFRGTRSGKSGYGATAFGEKGVQLIGPYSGYNGLLAEIIQFFKTGVSPVPDEETIEIYAFMEAAHESGRRGGKPVSPEEVLKKARKRMKKTW